MPAFALDEGLEGAAEERRVEDVVKDHRDGHVVALDEEAIFEVGRDHAVGGHGGGVLCAGEEHLARLEVSIRGAGNGLLTAGSFWMS